MSVRLIPLLLAAAMLAGLPQSSAAELATLFTTPDERKLINSNRYKNEAKPLAQQRQPDAEAPTQIIAREEVSRTYQISGISLAPDGAHTVWVNSQAHVDGAKLDDGSRINVETGKEIRLRITAPDGSRHFGQSGETVEFTYLAPVE